MIWEENGNDINRNPERRSPDQVARPMSAQMRRAAQTNTGMPRVIAIAAGSSE
jgi:Flp pilus assembly protein protease CpaA